MPNSIVDMGFNTEDLLSRILHKTISTKLPTMLGENNSLNQVLKWLEDTIYESAREEVPSPLISICIPTYNRAANLATCLESIYSQIGNDPHFEVIISNNASLDHTAEVCKNYSQRYRNFYYYENPENIGCDPNIAHVMTYATGEYIMPHGDDDFYKEGSLKRCFDIVAAHRDCGLFFIDVLRDTNEVLFFEGGINEYLPQSSVRSLFITSLILRRKEYSLIREPLKFVHTNANQIYLQYCILTMNPKFCIIGKNDFWYANNLSGGFDFAECHIRHYYTILNSFVSQGLSPQLIKEDQKVLLHQTLIPWFNRIKHFNLTGYGLENFRKIFQEYYQDEPYYDEAITLFKSIDPQF